MLNERLRFCRIEVRRAEVKLIECVGREIQDVKVSERGKEGGEVWIEGSSWRRRTRSNERRESER